MSFFGGGAGPSTRPVDPSPAPSTEAERHEAWESTIAKMEVDLMLTKRLLGALDPPDVASWQPPEAIGPLPSHLRERAERLLDEQRRIGAELVEALGLRRRQHAYAERVGRTVPGVGAVYVDVTS